MYNPSRKSMNQGAFKLLVVSSFFSWSFLAQGQTHIGVINDLNGTECQVEYPKNSIDNMGNMLRDQTDLDKVMFVGDLVHGECMSSVGKSKDYPNVVSRMWEKFRQLFLAPLLNKEIKYSAAPGNHDAPGYKGTAYDAERKGFEDFWTQRQTPQFDRLEISGAQDNFPYYWAYSYKNNLYIILESTMTYNLTNKIEQKKWLKAVLESTERAHAQKVIAMGHVPPYPVLNSSESKYDAVLQNEQVGVVKKEDQDNGLKSLMDMLLDGGVDLLLVAHSHVPYPAKLTRLSDQKSMRIVSQPCSHSPRKMFGSSARSPRGYSRVDVDSNGEFKVGIYNFEQNGSLIPYDFFPKSIPLKDSRISYELIDRSEYLD